MSDLVSAPEMSFGNKEDQIKTLWVNIITKQLRMTVDEFREAMNGNIPERFTNPEHAGTGSIGSRLLASNVRT